MGAYRRFSAFGTTAGSFTVAYFVCGDRALGCFFFFGSFGTFHSDTLNKCHSVTCHVLADFPVTFVKQNCERTSLTTRLSSRVQTKATPLGSSSSPSSSDISGIARPRHFRGRDILPFRHHGRQRRPHSLRLHRRSSSELAWRKTMSQKEKNLEHASNTCSTPDVDQNHIQASWERD